MTEKVIDIAVFGTGRMGSVHIHNLFAFHKNVAVRYIVSKIPEDEAALRARYPSLFSDPRHGTRFLDADEEDVVYNDSRIAAILIASPTPEHTRQISKAVAKGMHVFCEKPLAATLEQTKAVLKEAEKANCLIHCAFQRRFDPSFARAREEVESGRLGAVTLVRSSSRDPVQGFDPATTGNCSIFLDSVVHDIDMCCWMVGERPQSVYATASVLGKGASFQGNNWDSVTLTLGYPSGATAQVDNTRLSPSGYHQQLEVLGASAMAVVENQPEHFAVTWMADGGHSAGPEPYFQTRYREAYKAELDHFFAAVRGSGKLLITNEEIIQTLEIAFAAEKSARSGVPVILD